MFRPLRSLITACRAIRQAVTIYTWMKNAFAYLAAIPYRLIESISGWWMGSSQPNAGGATGKAKRKGSVEPAPNAAPRFPRLRSLVSNSGSRLKGLVDRIFPTPRKSLSELSNSSGESAGSRPCWSSSIGIQNPEAASERGSWRRFAGWSRRTSIKEGQSGQCPSGQKTNWKPSCRPDSPAP